MRKMPEKTSCRGLLSIQQKRRGQKKAMPGNGVKTEGICILCATGMVVQQSEAQANLQQEWHADAMVARCDAKGAIRTWAKLEALPALYWVTLCTVCLVHFLALQKVLLSLGTFTIWK